MKPVLLLFVLFLTGCNLAPKYHTPAFTLPKITKKHRDAAEAEPSDAIARGEWWLLFNDPFSTSWKPR